MQPLINHFYRGNEVGHFQQREELLAILKQRFRTYGYSQIQTATFEPYDLYATKPVLVNTEDMIKFIDTAGKVLVLRPDATIPITQRMAAGPTQTRTNKRFFYIMDVFRHSQNDDEKERTQAGIECFATRTPAVDAEVIALAIHTLKDCGFPTFKVEIGHAGFFKALIAQSGLSEKEITEIQGFIKTKNITEMTNYLQSLTIDIAVKNAIAYIPFLYGKPEAVMDEVKEYGLNGKVQAELTYLMDVYHILQAYELTDNIIFNLGLINDMNYYSDIIFQGFVDQAGKPVVMGGRYDHLGDRFGTHLPAIGFAFDVDLLLVAAQRHHLLKASNIDTTIYIYYELTQQKEALTAAFYLRDQGYAVISNPLADFPERISESTRVVIYKPTMSMLKYKAKMYEFNHPSELLTILEK